MEQYQLCSITKLLTAIDDLMFLLYVFSCILLHFKKHVFKCFFYLLITVFIIYAENDWKMAFSLHVFESVSDDYNFWLIFRL